MYERNAIVLERYFERIFGFTNESNLKTNFNNYIKIIDTINEYKNTTDEEENAIVKFDEIAEEIQEIQKREVKLHDINIELENKRNKLFNDLSENPSTLDNKFNKIEEKLENNNEELRELRIKYVKAMVLFTERQTERKKYARIRRNAESDYIKQINNSIKNFEALNIEDIKRIQEFIHIENEKLEEEIINVLIKNGKNERVPFYKKVIENAVKERVKIAKIEAELYFNIYDKTKQILNEIENESIKLGKAEKISRDTQVKLAFLSAEDEYIVSFLDNERMTAINGKKTHERLMEEACNNFEKDMIQIANLYELVLKETTNKSTKKAYKELYNKDYLRKIEDKEKDFEEEVTNIKVNIGTVINSNYWRIEGIKNIYKVFQEQISEKFNKDLSEFKIEEPDDVLSKINIENEEKTYNNIYIDDDEEDDNDYNDENDDENDEDDAYEYDDEENEDNYEYDDEDDEDDAYEYDDEEDEDNYEYDDEEDDDYEYDNEDKEYNDEEFYDEKEDNGLDEDKYNDEHQYEDDYDDKFEDEYHDNNEKEKMKNEKIEEIDNKEIILQEDEELTEEKIDEIIRNSRKKRKKKANSKVNNKEKRDKKVDNSKGFLGKIFNK